jgi:hypothetical protein
MGPTSDGNLFALVTRRTQNNPKREEALSTRWFRQVNTVTTRNRALVNAIDL